MNDIYCMFSFPAGELGNAVQDAFVIAVEQQARVRLQRLSALKRITPVDMSQLSIKVNEINCCRRNSCANRFLLCCCIMILSNRVGVVQSSPFGKFRKSPFF